MLVTFTNLDCMVCALEGVCVRGGAADMGIADRLFKRHGRWKSETAKDGYIKDALENRISVSQSLGL